MSTKPAHRFVIHPSIDSLAEQIAAVTPKTAETDVAALRESCRGKIRSYPLEAYLRSGRDPVAARERYEAVARFAAAARNGRA